MRGPDDKARPPITEADAAKGFLTGLWNHLGVVGRDGKTALAFPWNLFHDTRGDREFGMNTKLDPWTPTARGAALRMVLKVDERHGIRLP